LPSARKWRPGGRASATKVRGIGCLSCLTLRAALLLMEEPESGSYDFTGAAIAAGCNRGVDKSFELGRERDVTGFSDDHREKLGFRGRVTTIDTRPSSNLSSAKAFRACRSQCFRQDDEARDGKEPAPQGREVMPPLRAWARAFCIGRRSSAWLSERGRCPRRS
jgi:hypothetical protein